MKWKYALIEHEDQHDINDDRKHNDIQRSSTIYGINLKKYDIPNKRQILRNMVNPELGLYVFEQMLNKPILLQGGLFDFAS